MLSLHQLSNMPSPSPILIISKSNAKRKLTLLSFLSSIHTCTNPFAVVSAFCHYNSCRNHQDKKRYRQPNGYSGFSHTQPTIALHLCHSYPLASICNSISKHYQTHPARRDPGTDKPVQSNVQSIQ